MYNVIKRQRVNNEALFALARELFSMGKQIKFVVAGNSMYPFIRHNRDMVTLAGASFDEIKVSDIVLTYDATIKKYILHRVIKKTRDTYYMVGDAHTGREGPYTAENLIGVVTEIHRIGSNGSEKNISGSFYKLLARLWMLAKPCRPVIFRLYKFARGR